MIYEYACICGNEVEKEYTMGTAPAYIPCAECYKDMLKVIIVPPIHFKGSGFTKQSASGIAIAGVTSPAVIKEKFVDSIGYKSKE